MNYLLFNFSGVHRKERTPACHRGRKTEKEHVNYSIKMKNNDSEITKLRLTFEKSSGTSYVTIVLLKIMRKNITRLAVFVIYKEDKSCREIQNTYKNIIVFKLFFV